MVRHPPAEKLSLAIRKNLRDDWLANKEGLEKRLSEVLGETWTIDVNPNAIYPYHNDGWAKDALGSCIRSYIDDAIGQIKSQVERYAAYGDEFPAEVNTICSAHVLTFEVEDVEPARFGYCGCDVQDGKLRVLFRDECLGVNSNDACSKDHLATALNTATDMKPMSFKARMGILVDYAPKIERVRQQIAEMTERPDIKLNANFEETFGKLEAAAKVKGSELREDWENFLAACTLGYYEGLVYQLQRLNVATDELVREGFNEAVEKGEIAFRIVDKLRYDGYCECDIEDGILYLQTTTEKWGVNIDYVAQKLMDRL